MSNDHFKKIVNTNVQTSSILNDVEGALSSIYSTPGFTGYTIIKALDKDIELSDNSLQAISYSKILLLDGTSLGPGNISLLLGGDTVDNAKRLINIFGLNVNTNPKLITVVRAGTGANPVQRIYLSNSNSTTTYTYVIIDGDVSSPSYTRELVSGNATKNGYISVSLGNIENSILFTIVQKQKA